MDDPSLIDAFEIDSVDVDHGVPIARMLDHAIDGVAGDLRRPRVARGRPIADVQAHRDRGDAEKRRLHRGGHGARVDHVDADVRPAVHAADRDVRI